MDQHRQSGESGEQKPAPEPPPTYCHGARLDIELENVSLDELEAAAGILDRLTQGANPLRERMREGRKTP